jgi:glucose-1-phosphate cytidylyltransferase
VSAPSVVILCGGRGTRLREHTETIPKPLVEIGGRPILWHVIRIFAGHGFEHFVLCLGHRGELIADFVRHDGLPEGLSIECVDTGEETPTGGRVARVAGRLPGESFCVTYADGVADIDLDRLIAEHAGHAAQGALATMTVVQPELQFGVAQLNGDGVVRGFTEKPRFDGWSNGGFLCFQRDALTYIGETDVLERRPLERLAAEGRLRAFRHEGFWGCLDTYKDALMLNDLWREGSAPWKLWG